MIVSPVIKPVVSAVIKGLFGNQDPLVFHALTHAGASGGVDASGATLLPFEGVDVLRGIGTLTEGRTTTNLAPDHEGVWRSWGSGEAVREGWRQVENLLLYSEAFDNASWIKTNCTLSSGVSDPFGGTDAFTLTATNANALLASAASNKTVVGDTVIHSVWVRRRTGSGSVNLYKGDASQSTVLALTSSWQRFATGATVGTASNNFIYMATSGDEIDIYCAQRENATGRSSTNPSEYVPTTSAAAKKYFASTNPWEVTSNIATATATVTELTDVWTVGSPAHTNSITYSYDLTDASWLQSNTPVIAMDSVGMRGDANGAATLTDDSASAFEYVYQDMTVTANTNTHVSRFFVAKDNDETRFPVIGMFAMADIAGTRSYWAINTKTGESAAASGSPTNCAGAKISTIDHGNYFEHVVETVNTSQTSIRVQILPVRSSTLAGASDASLTGSCVVGNIEFHDGSTTSQTIAAVRGSSPIMTDGSAASTVASAMSFDPSNTGWNRAFYAETKVFGDDADYGLDDGSVFGFTATGGRGLVHLNGALYTRTSAVSSLAGSSLVANQAFKYALCTDVENTSARIVVDGVLGAEDTSATFDSAEYVNTCLGSLYPMLVRNLRIYDLPYQSQQSLMEEITS